MTWVPPKKMPVMSLLEKLIKLLARSAELEMRKKLLSGMAQLRSLVPKDPKLQEAIREMIASGKTISPEDINKLWLGEKVGKGGKDV